MSEHEPKWHDLNREQWEGLFDRGHWRKVVERALYDVISSPDADFKDRLFALQTLNEAIMDGTLEADACFPVLLRDTLCEIARGVTPRTRWWGRKRRRKILHARLAAARWMIGTVSNFPAAARPTQPEFEAQREVDPSRCS